LAPSSATAAPELLDDELLEDELLDDGLAPLDDELDDELDGLAPLDDELDDEGREPLDDELDDELEDDELPVSPPPQPARANSSARAVTVLPRLATAKECDFRCRGVVMTLQVSLASGSE
jgi:hypothetical protein